MKLKEYFSIAREIEKELPQTAIQDTMASICGGFPTLVIRVVGAVHNGWAYIQKDIAKNLYDIRLMDYKKREVKKEIENLEIEMLGATFAKLVGE